MKRYSFDVDAYQADNLFQIIRIKKDSIHLLMNALKIMLLPPQKLPGAAAKLYLHVAKMSRLFVVADRKMFSLNFPFSAIEADDGTLRFKTTDHSDINSKITSQVLSLLDDVFSAECREVLSFAEPILDICDSDEQFWSFFRSLLTFEDGYIRCDHDEKNKDGRRHPLHHLDVFYSGSSTFKVGLAGAMSFEIFSDVLDIGTDCHYLATPKN